MRPSRTTTAELESARSAGSMSRPAVRFHSPNIGRAILVLVAICLPAAVRAQSQDVADAARQEKERKDKEQASKPHHVYTEEDLKRKQILTPEDQLRAAARKAAPDSALPSGAALDAAKDSAAEESLGEIARRYRAEKLAAAALAHPYLPAESVRQHLPIPKFPLGVRPPALASPVSPLAVAPAVSAPAKPIVILGPQFLKRDSGPVAPVRRRDPFAAPTLSRSTPKLRLAPEPRQPQRPDPVWNRPVAPAATAKRSSVQAGHAPAMNTRPPAMAPFTAPAIAPAAPKPDLPGSVSSGREVNRLAATAEAPKAHRVDPAVKDPARRTPMPNAGSSLTPGGTIHVTVVAGDTLWQIAHRYLGRGIRWREITRSGGGPLDPLRLLPGTELVLSR